MAGETPGAAAQPFQLRDQPAGVRLIIAAGKRLRSQIAVRLITLQHGVGTDQDRVCDDDFHTVAMDLPGFGMSVPVPEPQTIEAMATGVTALLDALELESAVLLGHHTGAAVALEVAAASPERAEAIVLSSMPWVGPERRAREGGVGVDEADRQEDGSHLTTLWSLRQPYYPSGRPDLLDRFIRDALVPGLDPAEGHRACDRYVMDERIGLVRCPVLVMSATEDPFATPAVPHILEGLTGTDHVVQAILDGGTIPAMEQCAAQVAAHVRDFLAVGA